MQVALLSRPSHAPFDVRTRKRLQTQVLYSSSDVEASPSTNSPRRASVLCAWQYFWLALLNLVVSSVLISSNKADKSMIHGPNPHSPSGLPSNFQTVPAADLHDASKKIFVASILVLLFGVFSVWRLVRPAHHLLAHSCGGCHARGMALGFQHSSPVLSLCCGRTLMA